MGYPMHAELEIGNKFPDFELPDQTGTLRKLSHLAKSFSVTEWPRLSLPDFLLDQ